MKIIYIAANRIPTEKAHGYQIVKMCEAFARLGHEVELVLPRRRNHIRQNTYEYYGVEPCFKITYLPCLDCIPYDRFLGKCSYWITTLSFLCAARIFLVRASYDIVYTRNQFAGLFFSRVACEVHTLPKRITWLHRWLWNRASALIALTTPLRRLLIESGVKESAIIVAPDGVDLDAFHSVRDRNDIRRELELPSDTLLVGYVGKFSTMGMSKGVENLIRVFVHVKTDALLVIVGAIGDEIQQAHTLINALQLHDRVHVIPFQPRDRAFLYMRAMDVLVMPSPRVDFYTYYSSPLKLFEYMASGVPIIASDSPAIRDVLNDSNAVLVPAGDVSALAQGIDRLLSDRSSANTIAYQAKIDVERFTWHKRAEHIVRFITVPRRHIIIISRASLLKSGEGSMTHNHCCALWDRGESFTLLLPKKTERFNVPYKQCIRYVLPNLPLSFSRLKDFFHMWKLWTWRYCTHHNGHIIVHSLVDFPYAYVGYRLAYIRGWSYVMTAVGTYSVLPFTVLPDRWIFSRVFKKADKIVAISHFTAQQAQRVSGIIRDVSVIHLPASPPVGFGHEDYSIWNMVPRDKKYILSVAALKQRKGVDVLLKAFARVVQHNTLAHLLIVGAGDKEPYISLTESLGISGSVTFFSLISYEALSALYARCDIFSLTPRYVHHRFEGYGLVYLEAGYYKKPVVATDTGGVTDAVHHNKTGLIVPEGDVNATAQALITLLHDPILARRLGKGNYDLAMSRTPEKYIEEFSKLIYDIL